MKKFRTFHFITLHNMNIIPIRNKYICMTYLYTNEKLIIPRVHAKLYYVYFVLTYRLYINMHEKTCINCVQHLYCIDKVQNKI